MSRFLLVLNLWIGKGDHGNRSTYPLESRDAITCCPITPEPPVKTMRFGLDISSAIVGFSGDAILVVELSDGDDGVLELCFGGVRANACRLAKILRKVVTISGFYLSAGVPRPTRSLCFCPALLSTLTPHIFPPSYYVPISSAPVPEKSIGSYLSCRLGTLLCLPMVDPLARAIPLIFVLLILRLVSLQCC